MKKLKGTRKALFFGIVVSLVLALSVGSFALSDVLTPSSPLVQSEDTEQHSGTSSIMGDFQVTGDTSGCSFKSSTLTIKSGSPTISMAPGKSSTSNTIYVEGESVITLAGVNIQVKKGVVTSCFSALTIKEDASFNVIILLADGTTNILDGRNNSGAAGLEKTSYSNKGGLTIDAAGPAGDGKLIAYGGNCGAGIGTCGFSSWVCARNIIIQGGIIEAYGGEDGAGIGAGSTGYPYYSSEENTIITGGIVTAVGSGVAAGIGDCGAGKNNAIDGDAVVIATSGKSGVSPLEGFSYSQGIAFTRQTTSGGWSGAMYGSVRLNQSVQFPANLTVGGGQTLALSEGKSLTMASGAALYVGSGGTLVNDGTLPEDNSVVCQAGGTIKTQLIFYEKEGDFNTRAGSNEDTIYKSSGAVQKYQANALRALPAGADGWYSNWYGQGSKIATTENVSLNQHTACANYQCVVKFNTGVSSVTVPDQSVRYKAKAEDPGTLPITVIDGKKKYVEGWYKDASCTSKWDFNTDTVMPASGNEITLYAKWVDCLKVTFDLQGGTAADGAADEQELRGGDFATEPNPSKITRDGYTFKDWYTNPEGTGVSYDFAHTPVTKNLTLYAVWAANAYNINVSQPEHGHIEYPWVGDTDDEIHFTVHASDEGWEVNKDSISVVKTASGEAIDFSAVAGQDDTYKFTMPAADVTISASMEKITYTVTFDMQNGDATTTVPVQYGDTVSKPADPTYDGHEFDNWYTNQTGEGTAYDFNTPVKGNLTIYAHWFTIHDINLNKTGYGQINFNQTKSIKGQIIKFKMTPDIGWEISGLPTFTPEGESPIPVTRELQANTYSFTMPDKNVTVNATFKKLTFMVRFDTQTESLQDTSVKIVEYGERLERPEDPVREHYKFVGWYNNPQGEGVPYDFEHTQVTSNFTLYAIWTQTAFQIHELQPEHGHIEAPDYGEEGKQINFIAHAEDEGYRVKDGSVTVVKTATGDRLPVFRLSESEDVYSFTMPTEDVTITAEMEKIPYTVTFDTQTDEVPNPDSQIVRWGEYAKDPGDLTREHYQFVGWFDNAQGDGPTYDFERTPVKEDITIYAVWSQTAFEIHDIQPEHGHIEAPNYGDENRNIQFRVYAVDEGYEVKDVSVVKTASGDRIPTFRLSDYDDGYGFTMPAEEVTISADIKKITYTVTFKNQNGSPDTTETVEYGDTAIKPTDPTRQGYKFAGWYDNAACKGTAYDFDYTPVKSDLTLYAAWIKDEDAFAITSVQPEHGRIVSPSFGEKGKEINIKVHAIDDGWEVKDGSVSVVKTASGEPITVSKSSEDEDVYSFTMPGEDVIISAEMEKTICTVTIKSQNGEPDNIVSLKYGEYLTRPADPTRQGYEFVGWYDNIAGFGSAYDFESTPVTDDLTLYAIWMQNAFSITSNQPEHGAIVSPNFGEQNKVIQFRVHATDEGWDVKPSSVSVVNTATGARIPVFRLSDDDDVYEFTMPSGNVIITADMEKVSCVVIFKSQNGDPDIAGSVQYGEYITKPQDPTRQGYKFVSWYTNMSGEGAPYDFEGTPVTKDLTLYAVWIKDEDAFAITSVQPEHGYIESPNFGKKDNTIHFIVRSTDENWAVDEVNVKTTAGETTIPVYKQTPNGNEYKFTMPGEAVTISAKMKELYSINVPSQPEHGTIILEMNKAAKGDSVTFKAIPDDGYQISSLPEVQALSANSDVKVQPLGNNRYMFVMLDSSVNVSAKFELIPHDISVEKTEHGTIEVNKDSAVDGEEVEITCTPDEGYKLKENSVAVVDNDGNEIQVTEQNGKYLFTMPATGVSVSAAFEKLPDPIPDPSVDPDGGNGNGSGGASSKTSDPFMGGVALALLGVATTGAVLVRKRK